MDANRFVVKLDVPIQSRSELFHYVTNELLAEEKIDLVSLMAEREENGSVEIAEEIVLPHAESEMFTDSRVIIIRPEEKITWDKQIKQVKLVIVILLRKEETEDVKREISQFTRKLADDTFLDYLMETNQPKI